MKCFGFVGVVVLLMTASCGTDTARPPAPPASAGEGAAAAAAAKSEPGATAASADGAEKPDPSQATAKPSAPVNVTASIRPGAADLDVVFGADGTGITIQVWGVDGLKLTGGATPVSAPSVKSGQSVKVPVLYDAPTTESNLAVRVSGTFGGREQAKVQSFTINSGSPVIGAPSGESRVDKDGRRVKVMKSE